MLKETIEQQVWDLSLQELYLTNQKTLPPLIDPEQDGKPASSPTLREGLRLQGEGGSGVRRDQLTQLPKHQIWQSPLLFPDDMSDFEELDHRIKKAGLLWLKNRDLISHNVLIITHKAAWISYIFQRIQAPNQSPLNMIISRCLLREGIALPPYPLIFQEFVETLNVSQIESQ